MSRSVSRRSSPRRPPIRAMLSRSSSRSICSVSSSARRSPSPAGAGAIPSSAASSASSRASSARSGSPSPGTPARRASRAGAPSPAPSALAPGVRLRGTTPARWQASSREVARGVLRRNSTASARRLREALAPLGRVLGRQQRAPRACPGGRSGPSMKTSGSTASSSAAARRCSSSEALDPFACLRRHLRRLARGRQPEHEVELAPPRDLDHPREIDLSQLDRRAGERAHDRGGVLWIDQQPHPGEHVAHLRPPEEAAVLLGRSGGAQGRRGDSRPGHSPRIRGSAHHPGYALGVDLIDWGAAQRVGELVAGSPPPGGVRADGRRAARARLRRCA